MDRFGTHATALDGFQCAGVRQNVRRDRLAAPDQTLAGEVLLELVCFAGKGLRNADNTAVLQWREPAEMQFALFKIALPDALILDGEQQALIFDKLELFQQRRRQQRQRVNAGKGHSGASDGLQPGSEKVVIGQCGEHDALVLALALFVAQRQRGGQSGAEEQLPEFTADDGLAICTLQKRDGLDLETFFRDVGQNGKNALAMLPEVGGKLLMTAFARREHSFARQFAGMPAVGSHLVGAEVEQAAGFHW